MRRINPWNNTRPINVNEMNQLIEDINNRLVSLDPAMIGQGAALDGTLPTDVTGLANDVVLGQGCYHEVACPVATTLTGFVGGYDSRLEVLKNTGQVTITVAHEQQSSRVENRFLARNAVSHAIAAGAAMLFVYSGKQSRWLIIGLLD